MRSVPPARIVASGQAAMASSASSRSRGRRVSMESGGRLGVADLDLGPSKTLDIGHRTLEGAFARSGGATGDSVDTDYRPWVGVPPVGDDDWRQSAEGAH